MSRGLLQSLLMRAIDVILSFPVLLLAIALLAVTPAKPGDDAAHLRGRLRRESGDVSCSARSSAFASASLCSRRAGAGVRSGAIIVRHIVPHVLPSVVVYITLGVATAIIFEPGSPTSASASSRRRPPGATWSARASSASHITVADRFPGRRPRLAMVGFALLGDGLRDVARPDARAARAAADPGVAEGVSAPRCFGSAVSRRSSSSTAEGLVAAVRGVSFEIRSRRDPRAGRRVRLRQECHRAIDHGPPPSNARIIAGSVELGRARISSRRSSKELRAVRAGAIAMVFQDSMTSLNPAAHDRSPDHGEPRGRTWDVEATRRASEPSSCLRKSASPSPSGGSRSTRTSSRAGCASGSLSRSRLRRTRSC